MTKNLIEILGHQACGPYVNKDFPVSILTNTMDVDVMPNTKWVRHISFDNHDMNIFNSF